MGSGKRKLAEIVATVQAYVEGMVWGNDGMLRRVFHPKACVIGHYNGALEWDDLETFIASVSGETAAPGTKPYWRVNSTEVTGDTAVVQVENDWAGERYDDTLTLLHHDGRWQIVSKLFYLRETD